MTQVIFKNEADTNRLLLKNLIAECTCPVCQGLIERPRLLRCKHILCLRCLSRLHSRSKKNGNSAQCPVCKEKCDPNKAEADSTTECVLGVLQHIKKSVCQEPECWNKPDICCPDCNSLRCQQHHHGCIKKLQDECANILASAQTFATSYSIEEKMLAAQTTEASLHTLKQKLLTAVDEKINECKLHLAQKRSVFLDEQIKCKPLLDEISICQKKLKMLQASDDFVAMQATQKQLRLLLSRAKQLYPPMEMAPPPPLEECLRSLKRMLAQVRVDSIVRPYGSGESVASLCRCLRTRPLQPWDMALLTNLTDVYITPDSALTQEFKAGCRSPLGPCLLLINFKGFPTKRIHVYDSDAHELASVSLEVKSGEMPGKFAVCNQRQQILASEPSQHCVFIFSLSGSLLKRFGKRGSEPGCFNEPMSLFPCEATNTLFVVDSENKRVQMFNMAEDFAYLGKLEHPQFTGHVHSVHAGTECVVVSDRERRRLFAFDRASSQPIDEVTLTGQPFDFTSDQYGNVFVSLADERAVRIFNPSLAVPLYTVRIPKSTTGKATVICGTGEGDCRSAPAAAGGGGSSSGGIARSSDSSSGGEGGGGGDDDPLRRLLLARRLAGGASASASGTGRRPQIHGLAFLQERRRLYVADTFKCSVLVFDLIG